MIDQIKKPHILFLFSDTGGGHRSAAEAVIEALELEFGDAITMEMVDFLKNYFPLPLSKLPDVYPQMVKVPRLWEASYYGTDRRSQVRLFTATLWPYLKHSVKAMVRSHPADLIVSVHFLATTFVLKALGKNRPPFFTVVTDIATPHAIWFDKRSDRIFVPSEAARQRAIMYGMDNDKLEVVGLPVANRYCAPIENKVALRKKLGWPLDMKIVLLVGGGEGMGPLENTARAINEADLGAAMVIVTGRNHRLKTKLEMHKWSNQTLIYGFTRDMPDFMRAADILITKAGPSTVVEGLNANIPIVMYSKLPGQEDGNVTFIEDAGAGVFAPSPQLVVHAVNNWLSHPDEYEQIVRNAHRAARPDSARTIARIVGAQLGLIRIRKSAAL